MSRFFSCLCLAGLLLSLLLFAGCGGEAPEDTATNLLYISNGDGTCSFSGLADPEAAPAELNIPKVNYRNETVTSVSPSALYLNTTVRRIHLPDTVEEIGESAFRGSALVDIELPENLTVIGRSAFNSCTSLQYVGFGSRVTSIGESAFEGCPELTFIQIPGSVKTIGMFAFMECQKLQAVYIEPGVTALGDFMFKSCTSLSAICLPEGLREVGHGAFQNCSKLTSVIFRNGLESLKAGAFESCTMLSSVTLPATVKSIGTGTFEGCGFLSEIRYAGTQESLSGIQNLPDRAKTVCGASIEDMPDAGSFFNRSRKVNATVPILIVCAVLAVGFTVFWILHYRRIRAYRKEAERPAAKGKIHGR